MWGATAIGSSDFEQEDSEKFFFGHLVRSYDAFMSGADDEDGAQDAELEERFEMRNEAVQADVERLDEENAALLAQCDAPELAPRAGVARSVWIDRSQSNI